MDRQFKLSVKHGTVFTEEQNAAIQDFLSKNPGMTESEFLRESAVNRLRRIGYAIHMEK